MENKLTKEEVLLLLGDFLNESGHYYTFKEWVENQGYTMEEIGLPNE